MEGEPAPGGPIAQANGGRCYVSVMPMGHELLDAARLQAFVAVAREGGFSRAAARLGKSQSTVSGAVAALEADLGQALFVRDGRTTHLTDAGRALRGHAEAILGEMARARAQIEAIAGLAAGELVVGASDTLAYYLLPPVFAAFRARHPQVELRLVNRPSPATAAEVAARAIDVGVVTLPLPDLRTDGRAPLERVRAEPLSVQEEVLVCPPGHPLAGRRRVSIAALGDGKTPLLLLDRTTASRALLDEAWRKLAARPQVAMEMSSVEVLKRLVELGFGVSIVPRLAVGRETAAGALVAVKLEGLPARRIALLVPHPGPASRAAAAFAALAREVLARGARASRGR